MLECQEKQMVSPCGALLSFFPLIGQERERNRILGNVGHYDWAQRGRVEGIQGSQDVLHLRDTLSKEG